MLMKGFNSSVGFRAAVHCLTSLHFAMAGVFIMVWPRGGTLTLSLQQVIIGGVYVFMCIATGLLVVFSLYARVGILEV